MIRLLTLLKEITPDKLNPISSILDAPLDYLSQLSTKEIEELLNNYWEPLEKEFLPDIASFMKKNMKTFINMAKSGALNDAFEEYSLSKDDTEDGWMNWGWVFDAVFMRGNSPKTPNPSWVSSSSVYKKHAEPLFKLYNEIKDKFDVDFEYEFEQTELDFIWNDWFWDQWNEFEFLAKELEDL